MKDYRKTLIILLILFLHQTVFSQDAHLKEKVDQLNATGMKFLIKPDSLIIYANKAYDLAKTGNYKNGEAVSLKLKGIYEHRKSNFPKAILLYKQSLSIFTELNIPLEIGKANLNIATSYNSQHDFVNSIQFALKALKIFEELNEDNGSGRVLNLLGISASAQEDYKEALKYFKNYNALAKKAKDSIEIATSYNNIGSTFQKLNQLDSAIHYLKLSSQIHQRKGNITGLGTNYENIGSIYNEKRDYKNALSYFSKSLVAYTKSGDRKFISHSYYNIGIVHKQLKDTTNAIKWLDKAIKLANEVSEKVILKNAYEKLSEIKAGHNQYKIAYEHLKKSAEVGDSILNLSKNKIVEELKTKYEVDKKNLLLKKNEVEIANQKLKVQKRNIQLIALVIILFMVIILAYFVYNRRKLKAKSQLQEEVNKQQDLAARAVLDAEERERRRIAGDLHDGVGQMLSAALINLNGLFQKLKLTGENSLQAEHTLGLVNDCYDEMRSISHQMMPNALIKAGLASAIKEFLNKIDKDILKINLETVGLNQRLDEQTETVIYRMIQETVNNVIKHSGASKLNITVIKDSDGISATVEDNGKGFDKTKIALKSGIGIANMYSRVEFLKGTIDFDTAPGKGTLVAIHIPG
ncbi:sensor histidine kinase [Pedobacter sp. Du54]|uniref:tetratricopeptide repeat-containing sensor histidine kinase n=1 Tax=Pedobacter anseongensis TaxID=3133439 RepID=UPI0030A6F8A6